MYYGVCRQRLRIPISRTTASRSSRVLTPCAPKPPASIIYKYQLIQQYFMPKTHHKPRHHHKRRPIRPNKIHLYPYDGINLKSVHRKDPEIVHSGERVLLSKDTLLTASLLDFLLPPAVMIRLTPPVMASFIAVCGSSNMSRWQWASASSLPIEVMGLWKTCSCIRTPAIQHVSFP